MSAVALAYVYPDELVLAGPYAVAEQLERLGCDGAALALAYHPVRSWLPRYRTVRHSPPGALSFEPQPARYPDGLAPRRTADAATVRAVHDFRAALARRGLAFHAWLVVLHREPLVAARPDLAATTSDGTPTVHALCPSHPETLAFAAALVADVCAQLEPEGLELEAALPSTWNPSYVITHALEEPDAQARAALGTCACAACAQEAARGPGAQARIAARAVAAVTGAAEGAQARLLLFGTPSDLDAQGATPEAIAGADGVAAGLGTASGAEAVAQFAALGSRAGDRPVSASMNWAPERTPAAFADDVRAIAAGGGSGVALYHLSLVPDDGLPALAAAAGAAREAFATKEHA
jgi:hypothetical protein